MAITNNILIEQAEVEELVKAVSSLRVEYHKHKTRQTILPICETLKGRKKWHGTHAEGMRASQFLHKHYSDVLEKGMRLSDLRQYDEHLFFSLRNEAAGKDISELGIDQTNKAIDRRRYLLATILGEDLNEQSVADFCGATRSNSKKLVSR